MPVDVITVDGAELRREVGFGTIAKVEAGGGRNARVEVRAEHLKDPVSGWADTTADGYDLVPRAHREGRRVRYVVDTHRKRNVDPGRPFADLARDEKVRDLVELAIVDGDGAVLEQFGHRPPADGAPAGQAPLQQTSPAAPAQETAPPPATVYECPHCDVFPFETVEELEHHDRTKHAAAQDAAATPPAPPASQPARRRAKVEEAKPWEELNSDGSLNLGSYAVSASAGAAMHAFYLARSRDPFADGPVDVTPTMVRALTGFLLEATDRAQAAVRADGRVDRMARSHATAFRAVKTALGAHPVPFGADEDTRRAWLEAVVDAATMMLETGVELVDPPADR